MSSSANSREYEEMEIILAAAAFIGLFSMWVIVPRMLLKK